MKKLVIIGAGGHAKSVLDSVDPEFFEVIGFVDEVKLGQYMGLPIFGYNIVSVPNYSECVYVIAIGDVHARKRWYRIVKDLNLELVNIIDRSALVSPTVKMGCGNFIGKLAVVNAGSVLGDNNLINTMALVEHESRVANHTNLSTKSTINGDVVVEDCVFLGSGATCNGQLTLGEDCIVGSGSVVIRDVEPGTTVVGAPARVVKPAKGGAE